MAYIKYKEVTKYFNFSRSIKLEDLPEYVTEYTYDGEEILAAFMTDVDYGVFTTKKIILFDKGSSLGLFKQIYTIPYNTISTLSIIYKIHQAEFSIFLDSGYPLILKFINLKNPNPGSPNIYKNRLKYIYHIISKNINHQEVTEEDIKKIRDIN